MRYLLSIWIVLFGYTLLAQEATKEEKKLYELVMKYRKQYGLKEIPLSTTVTKVAQIRAKD